MAPSRWRIDSALSIGATAIRGQAAIQAESDFLKNWPNPATVVQLGAARPVGLPLGFAPIPTGGAPAIPGVRHVLLDDLLAAAAADKTLIDVAGV